MKKSIEAIAIIKSFAAMIFAGQAVIYVIVGSFTGLTSIPFPFVWQALAISVITAVLQFVAFSDAVIQRMKYSVRLVLFNLTLFAVLAGFAIAFKWFPFNLGTWLAFTAIFLAVCAVITFFVELYSRLSGKKYNEHLNAYKRKADGA